jgi:MFS superfamily sulfate permease-like transporter
MDQAGSRTQLPSIVAAVGTLLLALFGTALLEDIPSPSIGAIVAVAILPLLGVGELRRLWRLDRGEFAVGAICFLGALLLGPIAGIALAFVLSLIMVGRAGGHPARGVARTAVVAGTATAVSNRVSRRQAGRWAAQEQQTAAHAAPAYAPPPPPAYAEPAPAEPADTMDDKIAQLKELGALRDAGVLSDAEFEAQKGKILYA